MCSPVRGRVRETSPCRRRSVVSADPWRSLCPEGAAWRVTKAALAVLLVRGCSAAPADVAVELGSRAWRSLCIAQAPPRCSVSSNSALASAAARGACSGYESDRAGCLLAARVRRISRRVGPACRRGGCTRVAVKAERPGVSRPAVVDLRWSIGGGRSAGATVWFSPRARGLAGGSRWRKRGSVACWGVATEPFARLGGCLSDG
jgi:hypothetical protein